MVTVTITLPALLSSLVGEREIEVDAATVAEALGALTRRFPALDILMFDESGALREHVLCFHNEENTRWEDDSLRRPLRGGDRLTILQAVAGG